MKKFFVAAVISFFIVFTPGSDRQANTGYNLGDLVADEGYQIPPGWMVIQITYDKGSQTWEYRYLCRIFKEELGKILGQASANLSERLFNVYVEELPKESDFDEPAIAVSLDGQPICWVKINRLGTPEQIEGFARFSSELILRRLQEISDKKGKIELPAEKPKRIRL